MLEQNKIKEDSALSVLEKEALKQKFAAMVLLEKERILGQKIKKIEPTQLPLALQSDWL